MGDISLALDEYAKIAGLDNIDEQIYTDLAWGGLDFENSAQLTMNVKQRIQNRLLAEQLNGQVGAEKPVGIQVVY